MNDNDNNTNMNGFAGFEYASPTSTSQEEDSFAQQPSNSEIVQPESAVQERIRYSPSPEFSADGSVNIAEEKLQETQQCSESSKVSSKKAKKRKPPKRKYTVVKRKKTKLYEVDVKAMTQAEIHPMSATWNAIASIASVHVEEGKDGISEAGRKALEELIAKNDEPGCNSFEMEIDERLPGFENYRGILSQMRQLVMPPTSVIDGVPSETIPRLYMTGKTAKDPLTAKATDAFEEGHRWIKTGLNTAYETVTELDLFRGSEEVFKNEVKFFAEKRNFNVKEKEKRLPVAVYNIKSASPSDQELLKEIVTTTSMCVLRGMEEAYGFDKSKFREYLLKELCPNYRLIIRRQIPQSTSSNFYLWNDSGVTETANQWKTYDYDEKIPLSTFLDNYELLKNASKNARLNIAEHPDKIDEEVNKLKKTILEHTIPFDPEKPTHKAQKGATVLSFGTNLDLNHEDFFKDQIEEIAKFPDVVSPHGADNLLESSQETIAGVNEPQLYAKPPGARTAAHLENNALSSVNINLGPADCVWYGVPFEFSGNMQDLIKENCLLYGNGYWPSEGDLIKKGIPLQKFLQKPGDMVYVGIGTYHWVQANGFATNIAWNLAQPTFCQLAAAAIIHDHNLVNKIPSTMAIEPILWKMAEENISVDEDLFKLIKTILYKSLIKSTFEMDFIKDKNIPLKNASESSTIIPVERCGVKKCREVMFNIVTVNKDDEPRCFYCCSKLDNLNKKIVAYKRHELSELATIFDNYKLRA